MEIHSTFLVTGETACEAMAAEAAAAGAEAVLISTSLEDEATSIGRILGGLAAESVLRGRPFPCPGVLIGCGGEATVRLGAGDEFGLGGPNEEAALAAAGPIEGLPVAAVFLDTDGSDGGSDLAGAICDGDTAARAEAQRIDLRRALAEHRSGEAAIALGDGIVTGPTHTNVNDLFVIALGERRRDERRADDRARAASAGASATSSRSTTSRSRSPRGEFFSLLGPSGCGKTTTLRMIAGFEEPDGGRVILDGEDVTYTSPKRRNVNMVFQDYALFPHMTVAENVSFGLRLKRVPRAEAGPRVEEMLEVVPPRRPRRAPPGRALRRSAPARRPRASAGQPARRAAARRAARRAGPEAPAGDAARAEADPADAPGRPSSTSPTTRRRR